MSLSQREKTLLVITIFGLMVFCYGWFAYLPLQSKIAALQVDNQRLTQEQTKLEAIHKKQEANQPVNLSGEIAIIKAQLPTEPEIIPFLNSLTETTHKCDVEIASVEYQVADKDQRKVGTLVFSLEAMGSASSLFDFLQELLASPRFINITQVTFQACKVENSRELAEQKSMPIYHLDSPDIAQDQLEQVEVKVDERLLESGADMRVAESLIPNRFNMKVVINTYYFPEQTTYD